MPEHDGPRTEGFPCWVDLSVKDVDQAVRFYSAALGWEFSDTAPEYGGYRMASKEGRYAAGIGPKDGEGPSYWLLYFAVESVDRAAERAKELGGSVYAAPFDVGAQGRMAVISDPAGAVFGVWQAGEHHGFQASERPGFLGWAETATTDAERARAFYGALFGASSSRVDNPLTTYYTLTKDGGTIGGILQMTEEWAGIPPHWMPYFEVEDMDAATRRVKEAGGHVEVAPFDTAIGRLAVVSDPANVHFSMLQRAAT